MQSMQMIPVLVITGPVGVGKSSVAACISEMLDHAYIGHALIELDWLRWCHPAPPHDRFQLALGLSNLAAIWANYLAAGAGRLVLTDIVEQHADLGKYQVAIPGAVITVVQLQASLGTIIQRLERRESGASLIWHMQRAAELMDQMERNQLADLVVDTEGKSVTTVAQEVLLNSGWLVDE